MSFRSPIKDARGLGSAQHGVGHWWAQRVTAVALVPLTLWLVVGIAAYSGAGYDAATAWIGAPVNAVLLVLTIAVIFYHGALGIQVVLEDYVADGAARLTLIVLVQFAAILFAGLGMFAVLKIALGG